MKWYDDPVYIEMCRKATEIQYSHKPEEADYYRCACNSCRRDMPVYTVANYDIDRLNNRDLTNVEPTYAKMVKMSDVGSFVAYLHDRDEEHLSYIWLPTQGDLHEMIEDGEMMFHGLSSGPTGWFLWGQDIAEERIYPPDSLDGIKESHYSETAEQALLKGVMWGYGKMWNESDFVEIGKK